MDKITDKVAALPPTATYFSLEFFPPKTAMGFANLRYRLERMALALRPLFVNVTWGAGGSTAQKSLELAEICQRGLALTTCLHLTCTNMSKRLINKALEDAKALGIRNILALRGDSPRVSEYRTENGDGVGEGDGEQEFKWASDLVRYIRRTHEDYFCIGVAAYPEGHADESHPPGQCLEHDLPHLLEKTQAGADFIMTQLFFDMAAYEKFEKRLREHPSGVFKHMLIIPGLMPIQSYQTIKRTAKLSHARIPDDLMTRLDAVKGDDEKVKMVGVDIVSELVERIRVTTMQRKQRQGFHFYTLNLEKAVSFILERTGLIAPSSPENEDMTVSGRMVPRISITGDRPLGGCSLKDLSRRQSTVGFEPRDRVIVSGRGVSNPDYEATPQQAGLLVEAMTTRANTLAISEGEGALGREATWDDFPNGRFGDARSPAYGQIDGYGVSLHASVTQALQRWGEPRASEDISDLFVRHIQGELSAIPWSEEGFNPETSTIQDQLVRLNRKGWWTLASQPAVNGLRSDDATFGWGPASGFVFQKAFVEFFAPEKDWRELETRLRRPEMRDFLFFYASNAQGDHISSDTTQPEASAVNGSAETGGDDDTLTAERVPGLSTNAVTWGVFPGKEIVTPTIIEEVSFRAWSEEAFSIWSEWAKVYDGNPESRRFLEQIKGDLWLVNVIHHDYVDAEALWEFLLA